MSVSLFHQHFGELFADVDDLFEADAQGPTPPPGNRGPRPHPREDSLTTRRRRAEDRRQSIPTLPRAGKMPALPGRGVIDHALLPAPVDVRIQDHDAVAFRVLLQGFQVVEAHGLLVEKAGVELQGVVVLQPGGMISGDAEGEGVGLGEHVFPVELLKDLLGRLRAHSLGGSPLPELLPVGRDEPLVAAAGEGAPQLVCLAGGEAGDVHRQLVHLVLEEDDPQGAAQGLLLQGVVVGDRLLA